MVAEVLKHAQAAPRCIPGGIYVHVYEYVAIAAVGRSYVYVHVVEHYLSEVLQLWTRHYEAFAFFSLSSLPSKSSRIHNIQVHVLPPQIYTWDWLCWPFSSNRLDPAPTPRAREVWYLTSCDSITSIYPRGKVRRTAPGEHVQLTRLHTPVHSASSTRNQERSACMTLAIWW